MADAARSITDADVREFLARHPRTPEQQARADAEWSRLAEEQAAADARGAQISRLVGALISELQLAFADGETTDATVRVRRQDDWRRGGAELCHRQNSSSGASLRALLRSDGDSDLVDLAIAALPIFGCDLQLDRLADVDGHLVVRAQWPAGCTCEFEVAE